jgi:hypothetical protein
VKLQEGGFPVEQVSILSQNLQSEKKVHGFITACDTSKAGAKTGAWFGGLFGILVGAGFLWIPGVGPLLVAGPLAAVLLGGVEGAVGGAAFGGLLGGLSGWGISKKHILKYEERLKVGKFLVVAHGSGDELEKAKSIMHTTEPSELELHAELATNA